VLSVAYKFASVAQNKVEALVPAQKRQLLPRLQHKGLRILTPHLLCSQGQPRLSEKGLELHTSIAQPRHCPSPEEAWQATGCLPSLLEKVGLP